MNQESNKSTSAVGDIFMQNLKKQIDVIGTNSESIANALPVLLNKIVEENNKTNNTVCDVLKKVDLMSTRVDDICLSTKLLKQKEEKDYNVIRDVLMDFEKEYDMMKGSIICTRRNTMLMFIFMVCNTVLSSFVLIKMSALL